MSGEGPAIRFWYGERQRFGHIGHPQRWVNVLGNAAAPRGLIHLAESVNGGPPRGLWAGPDGRRLARAGDFNVEIDRAELSEGENAVTVTARDAAGSEARATVRLDYAVGTRWPLPYAIDWASTAAVADAVEVTDGLWTLTEAGLRTVEPSYDRMVAFGDHGWSDYELRTTVTVHDRALPLRAPPTFGVSHFALAARWPGHAEDEHAPHIKWFPLGSTSEFQLMTDLAACRWRTLLGGNRLNENPSRAVPTIFGRPYAVALRVRTRDARSTTYEVKRWDGDAPEPAAWDLTTVKSPEDVLAGGACLIAHNADVTFGDVEVTPL